jgi:hypothetical protein
MIVEGETREREGVAAYSVLLQVNGSDFWFVSFTFTMGTDDTVLTCPLHL